MDEAGRSFPAAGEDFRIACLDLHLFFRGDLAVMQGRGPIRRALKHCQMPNILGDGLDDLNGGRARADNANTLALEIDRIMRPAGGVEGLACEGISPGNIRQGGRGKRPQPRDQQGRAAGLTVFKRYGPQILCIIEMRSLHAAIEGDVLTDIKLVSNVIQIAQRIWLGGEMF